jgi:hypothetical protein
MEKTMKFEFDTTNLRKQIEEQPLIAAGIGAGLLTGAAKLLNAVSTSRNSKTWRKEVQRRTKNTKR